MYIKTIVINKNNLMTYSYSLRLSVAVIKHHACKEEQNQVIAGKWLELMIIMLKGQGRLFMKKTGPTGKE